MEKKYYIILSVIGAFFLVSVIVIVLLVVLLNGDSTESKCSCYSGDIRGSDFSATCDCATCGCATLNSDECVNGLCNCSTNHDKGPRDMSNCGLTGNPICGSTGCRPCQTDDECAGFSFYNYPDSTSKWYCASGACRQTVNFEDGVVKGGDTCYNSSDMPNDEVPYSSGSWRCKPN